MANIYENMNVRQKLSKARLYFLNQKIKKSGKHMKLEFKYFELEDIVPPAIRIFARVGLVSNTAFDGEKAVMTIYNTDNPEEPGIEFVAPYREAGQIISNAGNEVTTTMQALGSSITYLRRYLWMMALDITEPDSIDPNIGSDDEEADTPSRPTPPPTPAERSEIKEELVAADGNATKEEIAELKKAMKDLIEKDDTQEDFVQQIALKTEGLTKIASSACAELTKNLHEMIAAYGE